MTTPMPPLPQDQLDAIRDAQTIDWSPSSNHWLDKGRAEQLAEVIRNNHQLQEISIDTQVSEEAVDVLADALRGHPSLTSFRLKRQDVSMDAIRTLTDACFSLPQLEYFQLKEVGLTPKEIQHVAQTAAEHPNLNGLCLSKNTIDNTSAEALADMLERKRDFHYIRLMDCDLSDEAMVLLADRAAKQPEMVHFHLHYNPVSGKAADEVPQLMLAGGGLNLSSCLPYNDQSNRYCMENTTLAKELTEKLVDAHQQHRAESILTHAQVAVRLPSMRHLRRESTTGATPPFDIAEAYMQALPVLDASNDVLRTDDRGLCPAENPATWQDAEATLQRLEQAGTTIDRDWLQQKTSRGDTLLACALTANAHAVIPALNRRNIRIQNTDMLDANRQPTPLLENMITQNSCAAIFQEENWKGGKAEDARSLLHALPDAVRQRIGNTYQLLSRIGAEQQASAGRGR